MVERVQIQVDAETGQAVNALGSVAGAGADMGSELVDAVRSTFGPFKALKDTIVTAAASVYLLKEAFDALQVPFEQTIGHAIEMRSENDALVVSLSRAGTAWEQIGQSIGEVVLGGLEASGMADTLAGALEAVRDDILDADSALGQLVRGGLTFLVRGMAFGLEGVIQLVRGISLLVSTAKVADDYFAAFLADAEAAVVGVAGALTGSQLAQAQQDFANDMERLGAVRRSLASDDLGDVGRAEFERRDAALVESVRGSAAAVLVLKDRLAEIGEAYDQSVERQTRAQDAWDAATTSLGEQNEMYVELIDNIRNAGDALEDFIIGMSGDATLPTGGGLGAGAGDDEDGPKGVFDFWPKYIDGMKKFEVEADNAANSIGDTFRSLQGGIAGTLSGTLGDIGAFVVGAKSQFESLGEAMKSTVGSAASMIGNAFMSAGVAGLLSGNPFAAALGIGGLFAAVGGMLSGGRGTTSTPSAIAPDVMPASFAARGQGGSVTYNLNAGATFFSRASSRREVASLFDEAVGFDEVGVVTGG